MKKLSYFVLKIVIFSFLASNVYSVLAFSSQVIVDKTKNFDGVKNQKTSQTDSGSDMDFLVLGKDFKLKMFFKTTLGDLDKANLLSFINHYVTERDRIEGVIDKKMSINQNVIDEKKELLNEKKEFYKNILIYIQVDFIKAYIDYIASDIKEFAEKNDVGTSLTDSGGEIDKIEGRIVEHSNILDMNFKVVMEEKINDNITKLTSSPQFKYLTINQKNTMLDSLMKKIDMKLADLNKIGNTTDTFNKQKEVYKLLNQKLMNLKNLLNK